MFKKIFGRVGNEISTKSLIECITNDEIKEINLDGNTILDRDIMSDKLGILDIKAILNNSTPVDIEMQLVNEGNIEKRLLFYWSKMYVRTVEKGDDYKDLKRTIVIMIANFELENLKDIPRFHTKWKILETNFLKKVLTEDFEIDIVELPKVERYLKENPKEVHNKELILWTKFFTNPEALEEKEMEEYEAVKKAKEELDEIFEEKHEAELAELRLKYIRDKKSGLSWAKRTGFAEGKEKGIKEGKTEGARQEKIEIAKKMLQQKIDIDNIIICTGLTKEEIEELKKN